MYSYVRGCRLDIVMVTVSGIKEVVNVVLLFRDTLCFHGVVEMTRALETESGAS